MPIPLDALEIIVPFCDDVRNIYYMRKSGWEKSKIATILHKNNRLAVAVIIPLVIKPVLVIYGDTDTFEYIVPIERGYHLKYQTLSPQFIQEFRDPVQWVPTQRYQVLNPVFIWNNLESKDWR